MKLSDIERAWELRNKIKSLREAVENPFGGITVLVNTSKGTYSAGFNMNSDFARELMKREIKTMECELRNLGVEV